MNMEPESIESVKCARLESEGCNSELPPVPDESSLPILGNRSLPPHRLHEKKSLGVVRYLDSNN